MIANTITNHSLTSLLIPSQLPEYIRDDPSYSNFVLFLQAYYEWLELNGNVTEQTKNLLKYKDIDQTTTEFIQYFYNDFLSYFPTDILANKTEVVKLAKQLYQSKGTPASYKMLFRILYNSDVDFLNTNDVTLKASSGQWYVTKSIKLSTDVIYISSISPSSNAYINTSNNISITTVISHYLAVGDTVVVSGVTGTNAPNGSWIVSAIPSLTSFSFISDNVPTGVLDISGASVYLPHGYVNENFLQTKNLRVFGETSQTIATVENVILSGTRMEVFLSNIERLFVSGEYVRIVDGNNEDVLVPGNNNKPLRAKILGQISQIKLDPKNQGTKYGAANTVTGYAGDPVIAFGGLNTPHGHGATATVGQTTLGSIQKIIVVNGGYGYANSSIITASGNANTMIVISANSGGAIAHAGDIAQTQSSKSTVTFIPTDSIPMYGAPGTTILATLANTIPIGNSSNLLSYHSVFANNTSANWNTTLANAFTFTSFNTGYLASVVVDNGGGGISGDTLPAVTVRSVYGTNANTSITPPILANLANMGILSPIQIISGGTGYRVNDKINILGGTGYGANAYVTNVTTSGIITSVGYTANGIISMGGNGYTIGTVYPTQNIANTNVINTIIAAGGYKLSSGLPVLRVSSANTYAANAVLVVPGILGSGAILTPIYNGVGTITQINISDYGEDYVSAPSISLRVQDILVNGLLGPNQSQLPQRGDVVYQGDDLQTAHYVAYVDSIYPAISNTNDFTATTHIVRVYNYTSNPASGPLLVSDKSISMNLVGSIVVNDLDVAVKNTFVGLDFNRFNKPVNPGIIIYGDGLAKANSIFLNGLTIGNGQYLDTSGQLSSFNVLQSKDYNTFTYQITLDKEIAKYRTTLLNLLHPTGMRVVGRCAMSSNASVNFGASDYLSTGKTLQHYTGNNDTITSMSANVSNVSISSNTVNILIPNANTYIIPNQTTLSIVCDNGTKISGMVTGITSNSNTAITLSNRTWVNIANVANITANAGSNVIHITSITNSYNIINNGIYTNTNSPITDIVNVGDKVLIANNSALTVSGVTSNTIVITTNISSNVVSLLSVNKTLVATSSNVTIYNPA